MLSNRNLDFNAIGSLIKELREYARITQEELAKDLSVTKAAISQWESGSGIKTEKLYDIAHYFGVTVEELITCQLNFELDSEYLERAYDLEDHPDFASINDGNISSLNEYLKKCTIIKNRTYELISKIMSGAAGLKNISELRYAIEHCFYFTKQIPGEEQKCGDSLTIIIPSQEEDEYLMSLLSGLEINSHNYNFIRNSALELFINDDVDFQAILDSNKKETIQLLMGLLDLEEKDYLLDKYLHKEEYQDIEEVEKSLPIRLLVESGARCLFDANQKNVHSVSAEELSLFENIKPYNKLNASIDSLVKIKESKHGWRDLSFEEYQNLIDERKTDHLRMMFKYKEDDPLLYYDKLLEIYDYDNM